MSEIKKQTAVAWFNQQLIDRQNGNGDSRSWDEIFEQAKEMEEDQRMELADAAYEAGKLDSEFSNMFDDPKARFMNSVKNNDV